eukprot:g18646.t1
MIRAKYGLDDSTDEGESDGGELDAFLAAEPEQPGETLDDAAATKSSVPKQLALKPTRDRREKALLNFCIHMARKLCGGVRKGKAKLKPKEVMDRARAFRRSFKAPWELAKGNATADAQHEDSIDEEASRAFYGMLRKQKKAQSLAEWRQALKEAQRATDR